MDSGLKTCQHTGKFCFNLASLLLILHILTSSFTDRTQINTCFFWSKTWFYFNHKNKYPEKPDGIVGGRKGRTY